MAALSVGGHRAQQAVRPSTRLRGFSAGPSVPSTRLICDRAQRAVIVPRIGSGGRWPLAPRARVGRRRRRRPPPSSAAQELTKQYSSKRGPSRATGPAKHRRLASRRRRRDGSQAVIPIQIVRLAAVIHRRRDQHRRSAMVTRCARLPGRRSTGQDGCGLPRATGPASVGGRTKGSRGDVTGRPDPRVDAEGPLEQSPRRQGRPQEQREGDATDLRVRGSCQCRVDHVVNRLGLERQRQSASLAAVLL